MEHNTQQAPQDKPAQAGQDEGQDYARLAKKFIYGSDEALGSEEQGKKTFDSLVTLIRAGKSDPSKAIAQAAVGIVDRMEQDTGPIDDENLQKVGMAVVAELLDLAVNAGVIQQEQIDEQMIVKTAGEAFGAWMKKHPDRVDQEAMKSMTQSPQGQQAIQQFGIGQPPPQQAQAPAQAAPGMIEGAM